MQFALVLTRFTIEIKNQKDRIEDEFLNPKLNDIDTFNITPNSMLKTPKKTLRRTN